MSTDDRPPGEGRRGFATTRWSLVLASGDSASDGSERALEELCAQYWYPLYAYARRRGYDTEDARDLTQAVKNRLDAGDQLVGRLLAATAMIERGKIVPAINQLGALINQLEAKRDNDQLDEETGNELIACVQAILDGLG